MQYGLTHTPTECACLCACSQVYVKHMCETLKVCGAGGGTGLPSCHSVLILTVATFRSTAMSCVRPSQCIASSSRAPCLHFCTVPHQCLHVLLIKSVLVSARTCPLPLQLAQTMYGADTMLAAADYNWHSEEAPFSLPTVTARMGGAWQT